MKKKESEIAKNTTKGTQKVKSKQVRFRLPFPTKAIQVDTPEFVLKAMADAGITNRTAYLVELAAIDLLKRAGTDKHHIYLTSLVEALKAK